MTSLALITSTVAAEFGMSPDQLMMVSKAADTRVPRQIATLLCHEFNGASHVSIGREFSQHHTTVMHSIARVRQLQQADRNFDLMVKRLREQITAAEDLREVDSPRPWLRKLPKPFPVEVPETLIAAVKSQVQEELEDVLILPRDLRHPEMLKLFSYDGSDRPSAGTGCAWCAERGHFCPAKGFCGEFALCAECGRQEPCGQDAAIAKMRTELAEFETDGYRPPVCRTIPLSAAQRLPQVRVPAPSDWTIKASLSVENLRRPKLLVVAKPARAVRARKPVAARERVAAAPRAAKSPKARPMHHRKHCACGRDLDPRTRSPICRECRGTPSVAACVGCGTPRRSTLKGAKCRACLRKDAPRCAGGCGAQVSGMAEHGRCFRCYKAMKRREGRVRCTNGACRYFVGARAAARADGLCGKCANVAQWRALSRAAAAPQKCALQGCNRMLRGGTAGRRDGLCGRCGANHELSAARADHRNLKAKTPRELEADAVWQTLSVADKWVLLEAARG